jgi:putative membrane protein
MLDLASVHVDSTPGPVKVSALHLDVLFASQVAHEQADRAERARAADRTIHWAASEPAVDQPSDTHPVSEPVSEPVPEPVDEPDPR